MSRAPGSLSTQRAGKVVVLVYDGLAVFEFGVAVEFFGLKRPEFDSWYDFSLASAHGKTIVGTGGVSISGAKGLRSLRDADTIVIPGWVNIATPVPRTVVRSLLAAHGRGARLISFCSGAFVLAATGLLDGKRATTHWRYASQLSASYPRIQVDPNVLFVDEGSILTSAGSAAAIDLCLHVVRGDFGSQAANTVARRLVVAPHRDGGQSQFIEKALPIDEQETALTGVLTWIRNHLDDELSVPSLAKKAKMSERTFARHFVLATGTSPHRFITHERLLRAQHLLECTELDMEEIAGRCGFGSALTLRHHFVRAMRLSPTAYRLRFRQRRATSPKGR